MSGVLTRGARGNEYSMTYRMNRWVTWTARALALAATGSACTGTPVDFESGSAGAGAAAETGGTGGSGGGTTAGAGGALGGTAGALSGTGGTTDGEAGEATFDPYAPRSGSFKALIYSEAANFVHTSSTPVGQEMFVDLAAELDFEVTIPSTPGDFKFTASDLANYDLVVFLNTSGEILDSDEEAAFEEWMVAKHGAFVGIHAAADTEPGWAFYKELTGQYYDQHTVCCTEAQIAWEPDVLDFPAVRGLPSPWPRSEEWYRFRAFPTWSAKPGFKILGKVQVEGETQPVSFVREFGNFRSFYTSLGHEAPTFRDPEVRAHIAGGLLWAVRREQLLD
jgi:type 1 glutamine amidotransferase